MFSNNSFLTKDKWNGFIQERGSFKKKYQRYYQKNVVVRAETCNRGVFRTQSSISDGHSLQK